MTTCPICGAKAKTIAGACPEVLSLRCPTDGDFDLVVSCLDEFCRLDLATRHSVLNLAIKSCDLDARPSISQPLIWLELQRRTAKG